MERIGAYDVLASGAPLEAARIAMIMVHGRGATAPDILTLAAEIDRPELAYLAPQAPGNAWYPLPFMSPIAANEPHLTDALGALGMLLARVEKTVSAERVILLGFSQGACLTTEFAARNARRFGGVVGLSGGLIGPAGTPRDYPGQFEGTPVFLGCSDIDPHIPKERVQETGEVMGRMGARVTLRLYEGMGHTVSPDEIAAVREIVDSIKA
ncbi:MAG TPA: dienelactone hydrolase family protein [Patescibacteria group bacterium]|nr:dienelactone hydrolase family protein [Patescibacteria group bacterium]